MNCLSQNRNRNLAYLSFLDLCRKGQGPLQTLADLGAFLMRREKVFHHFFADHSLRTTALHLALFSLKLPYEYKNPSYLNRSLNETEAKEIIALFERRIVERIPLAYLTQETSYLGRNFYVNENVLVPRSLMNTRFEEFLKKVSWENNRVLDLCTGSGCIGISLALQDPKLRVDLADISPKALDVASVNVKRYQLEQRVTCLQSDLFTGLQRKYDLIITNPPYVSDYEYQRQPDEIKNEPALALKGGKDGLDLVNRILVEAKDYLNPKGILIAELGYGVTQRLKLRYPKVPCEYLCYKKPAEKAAFWAKIVRGFDLLFEWSGYMDSIMLCEKKHLPSRVSEKIYFLKSPLFRVYRFFQRNLIRTKALLNKSFLL